MKWKLLLIVLLLAAVCSSITLCFAQPRGTDHNNGYQGNNQNQRNQHDRGYAYEGTYERHGDIFIFTDKNGKEFDLYVKPINRAPRWVRVHQVEQGQSYNIKLTQTRMYPKPEEQRSHMSLSFKWGNLSLENGKYYRIYTSSNLVNVRGRLYIKG